MDAAYNLEYALKQTTMLDNVLTHQRIPMHDSTAQRTYQFTSQRIDELKMDGVHGEGI